MVSLVGMGLALKKPKLLSSDVNHVYIEQLEKKRDFTKTKGFFPPVFSLFLKEFLESYKLEYL